MLKKCGVLTFWSGVAKYIFCSSSSNGVQICIELEIWVYTGAAREVVAQTQGQTPRSVKVAPCTLIFFFSESESRNLTLRPKGEKSFQTLKEELFQPWQVSSGAVVGGWWLGGGLGDTGPGLAL